MGAAAGAGRVEFGHAVDTPSAPVDTVEEDDVAGLNALVLDNPGGHADAPNPFPNGDFQEKIPEDTIHQTFFCAH